jgi:hypothetical protein
MLVYRASRSHQGLHLKCGVDQALPAFGILWCISSVGGVTQKDCARRCTRHRWPAILHLRSLAFSLKRGQCI